MMIVNRFLLHSLIGDRNSLHMEVSLWLTNVLRTFFGWMDGSGNWMQTKRSDGCCMVQWTWDFSQLFLQCSYPSPQKSLPDTGSSWKASTLHLTSHKQDVVQIAIEPESSPAGLIPDNGNRPMHLDNSHTIDLCYLRGVESQFWRFHYWKYPLT